MDELGHNRQIWNAGAYEAWINRFGTPAEAAAAIAVDPVKRAGPAYRYFGGAVEGKKIINLLGSNGTKATALALLGADVTVADFSADNERYASELAQAANVKVRYLLADVLQLPAEELTGDYDIAFMENGILHYFLELGSLFKTVHSLLRPGGLLVVQDFHPISTKLIRSRGTTANIRKHKVDGDYFDTAIEEKEAPFVKFMPASATDAIGAPPTVRLRHWTLGEIVTAVAEEDLCIRRLDEQPNGSSDIFDKGIPKTFTLTAVKL